MIEHGSEGWRRARLGIPTGSEVHRIMYPKTSVDLFANEEAKTTTKTRDFSERTSYAAEKLVERITGAPFKKGVSWSAKQRMEHGSSTEPEALMEYAFRKGVVVEQATWIQMDGWGCTPDGLVGEDGIVSIKCPETKTFVLQLAFSQKIEHANYWQAIAEMAATGRIWVDLAFYDPRIPSEDARMFIRRIPRDEDAIVRLLNEIRSFNKLLDQKCQELGVTWPPVDDDVTRYLMAG